MKKYFVIYMITNIITGKSYIGQSVDFEARKIRHLSSVRLKRDNYYLHRSIRKHGEEKFKWIIITKCCSVYTGKTQNMLNNLEVFFIAYYDTYNNGYNLTVGGDGMSGYRFSEEIRQKMSESVKGEKNHNFGKHPSKETLQKLSEVNSGKNNYMFGKHHTRETRQKISKALSGENSPMFGKLLSEETRQKISKANKGKKPWTCGKKHSDETKQKISKAHIGKKLSNKTKQKISENNCMAKPVIINGKYYDSITQAEKDLNIGRNVIPKRIKNGQPGYCFGRI